MSTTFEVFPATIAIPSFESVLDLSNKYLKKTLDKYNIECVFQIDVNILKKGRNINVSYNKSGLAQWNDDEYAWFTIVGQVGGCDAYFWIVDDLCHECWNDNFKTNAKAKKYEQGIRKCLNNGAYWNFRRSAGQPAIINLSYGLIAAAFAKLTDGFIFSDDSAWEYALFPAKTNEFLQYYFNPNCKDIEYGNWAKECLNSIKGEK